MYLATLIEFDITTPQPSNAWEAHFIAPTGPVVVETMDTSSWGSWVINKEVTILISSMW